MLQKEKSSDRIVQIGQRQRSQKHFDDAIQYVRSGVLGKIRVVKVWSYQGWMKPVPVKSDTSVPDGVDYDMWFGPALNRPFTVYRFNLYFLLLWVMSEELMT